jgi:hypothetical protein
MPNMNTTWTKFRLTPDDLAILDAAASRLGVSRAAVVRSLIHRHAGKLKVAEASPNDPTKTGRRRKPAGAKKRKAGGEC